MGTDGTESTRAEPAVRRTADEVPPQALAWVDRLVAAVRRVGRKVAWLAVAAAVAGAVIWLALEQAVGAGDERVVILAVVAAMLLFPPICLALFVLAARALASLPQRLRGAPAALRERAADAGRRIREVRVEDLRGKGPIRSLLALVALSRSLVNPRDVLGTVLPASPLVSPWVLVAAVVGAFLAVAEIVVGLIALVWLAVG